MGASPRTLLEEPAFRLLREEFPGGVRFILPGDLTAEGAERVFGALESHSGAGEGAELLLDEADLADGAAVARMVDAVRLLLARFGRVRLVRSPQVLAHTIYRAGMLRPGSRLELIEPREEEGRAS